MSSSSLKCSILFQRPPLKTLKQGDGWRIAWGFLRPVGPENHPNIGVDLSKPKRLRLQLYYHTDGGAIEQSLARKHGRGRTSSVPKVYYSFLASKLRTYPATIYVSVTGVKPPPIEDVERRPRNVFERESHHTSFEDALVEAEMGEQRDRDKAGEDGDDASNLNEQAKRVVRRTRAEGEPCLVPDTVVARIPVGNRGCYAMSFSNNGRYLAAACEDSPGEHLVRVFEVESGKPTTWGMGLAGHHAVIYNVCWNKSDTMLASASSDSTVIVWPVPRRAVADTMTSQDNDGGSKKDKNIMTSPGVGGNRAGEARRTALGEGPSLLTCPLATCTAVRFIQVQTTSSAVQGVRCSDTLVERVGDA